MFRSLTDFAHAWAYESESTLKIFRAIPESAQNQAIVPGGRTLASLAWHIATSIGEMFRTAGVPIEAADEHAPQPAAMAEIIAVYEKSAALVVPAVQSAWSDTQLDDELPMYGEQWKKGFILSALNIHQTHHRGQMTVLMRQAGLQVPGIYGPAEQEWAAMGLPAPA